ncbi:MAG: YopX family protein [Candidatus Nanoarchaeia archaeon]|nr:YopX family protein [Candidatus Nanoarchaeia archaeon]
MREIKFRAWDTEKKKWINQTNKYPFWIIGETTVFDLLKQYSIQDFNNIEIMQYTGLKDNTKWEELSKKEQNDWLSFSIKEKWEGREIYENDIIKRGDTISAIIFENGCFTLQKGGSICDVVKPMKIIGNIYENPELMKGNK